MITNEQSYRVRTSDGKELHIRRETIERAAEDAADLLGVTEGALEVTDRHGKVRYFSLNDQGLATQPAPQMPE